MQINELILKSLCRKFKIDISGESIIIFAIRGSYPLQSLGSNPIQAGNPEKGKPIIKKKLTYKEAACSIGIWMTGSGEIVLFPGSTVPSLNHLHRNPDSRNYFNILCPGKYRFIRGIHPRNVAGYQRHEALIMQGEGWIIKPELIRKPDCTVFNFNRVDYDVVFPGDNIHASRSEPYTPNAGADEINPVVNKNYSSSGCFIILGQPMEYVKSNYSFFWNTWEQFMQLINTFLQRKNYSLLLFNYSDLLNDERYSNRNILRYGSNGSLVTELQIKLSEIYSTKNNRIYYTGEHDGHMQAETVKAYIRFMKDFSPRKLSGEVSIEEFRSITRHFKFKLKDYEHVIN